MNMRLPAYGLSPSDVYPGYGHFGAPPPMGAIGPLNTVMDNVLDALQRGLVSVKVRSAIGGAALDVSVGSGIHKLNTTDRAAVSDGTMTPTQWIQAASGLGQVLIAAANAVGDSAVVELINSQLVKAQQDFIDIAAGRYGVPWWVWVTGAGVGAFVLWKLFGEKRGRFSDVEPEDALDEWD
jgi:hypothetical protein